MAERFTAHGPDDEFDLEAYDRERYGAELAGGPPVEGGTAWDLEPSHAHPAPGLTRAASRACVLAPPAITAPATSIAISYGPATSAGTSAASGG